MPEKRTGVFDIIKGVFRHKKEENADIVRQAEMIISNYIGENKSRIIGKYKIKNRILNFLLICTTLFGLYLVYRMMI